MSRVHHKTCTSMLSPSHFLSFVEYSRFVYLMSLLDYSSKDGKE